MSVTIRELVEAYLPDDAPPELRAAMCEAIAMFRYMADRHGICAACLIFAVADLIDQAVDSDAITHDNPEGHVEIQEPEEDKPVNHPGSGTVQ